MSEPVAYVNNMCNDSIDWKVDPIDLEEGTPLYTHPAKTLTDEEITQILKQHDWYSKTWVDMVKSIESAILRKAQEK